MSVHDTQKWIDLGAAMVLFNGVDLGRTVANPGGGTHGGVRFRMTTEQQASLRDAKGSTPHDKTYMGCTMQVQATLTGVSLVQLAACIPGAVLTDGVTKKALELYNPVGITARSIAGSLTVKPLVGQIADTSPDNWLVAAIAAPELDMEVAFELGTQKIYAVTFNIYDDLDTGLMARIGVNAT